MTELLSAIENGDASAWDRLAPLVEAELRRIAHRRLARRSRQSVGVTDLVNETYVRLLQRADCSWQGRRHFYGVVARAMQGLLIDRARSVARLKRGGGRRRVTFHEDLVSVDPSVSDLLAIDELLERLRDVDPQQHEIVMLRYFGGLGVAEVAAALGVSASTVDRQWRFARAWLRRGLDARETAGTGP